MSAVKMQSVEFDDQIVQRSWNQAKTPMDWSPFPIGYGILLNERYQFPMDMALARMKLDTSRQLFIDDHLIGHMEGLTRETHPTRDHPENPIFAPYKHYGQYICPDPEQGYRLYYNAGNWELRVALSRDGVNWDLPDLNVIKDGDSPGPNNVVCDGELHGLFFEPDDPNPDRRWKAIIRPPKGTMRHSRWPFLRLPSGSENAMGVPFELHISPDGYRWKFEAETNHWKGPTGSYDVPDHHPLGGGDVLRVRWDPKLETYVCNTKHVIGPDYRMSPIIGGARVVAQRESSDLVHWSAPRIYAYPDGEDAKAPLKGMLGIYEADGYPYESMWLNNFSMSTYTPASKHQIRERNLMPTRPYLKRNWIRKVASRDGRHWYYFGDREPFIPLGAEDSWKPGYIRAINLATTGGPVVKDDELWYYYRGMSIDGPKNIWNSSTGIAILRRDGFASLNADEEGGLVITRPLVYEGDGKLHVNADVAAGGHLRVSVVDEDTAEPVNSFSEKDSVAVTENSTRATVRWRGRESLKELKDRYIRLAFHLKNTKIYSFWVT